MVVESQRGHDSLVIFTRASAMLAEADTIQRAHELQLLALTAADWAVRMRLGGEAIQHCRSYALDAERRMGEMLRETQRAKGTAGQLRGSTDGGVSGGHIVLPPGLQAPTLAAIGVTKRQSSQAQRLAALPREKYVLVRSGERSRTQVQRELKAQEVIRRVELPTAKYRVFYADPPWSYGNTQPDYHSEPRDHYPVMSLGDICALPIKGLCEPDAVLFLWVTSPILEESFQVIKAWGFKYKSSFVWDKVKHNMGHYNSVRHEFLLICVRGSCPPDVPKLADSVQSIERTEHSRKPEAFYGIIEALYPHGKRLELFARGEREGWDGYGHEA